MRERTLKIRFGLIGRKPILVPQTVVRITEGELKRPGGTTQSIQSPELLVKNLISGERGEGSHCLQDTYR